MVLEPQQGAKVPADAAAHLQRSALAAGRAAAQVGEHRTQKDSGHQQNADRLAALHGADNVVGAHALALCYLIKGGDEQTCHRQKEQQPGLRGAQLSGVLDGKVEQGAQKSTEQTHGNGQKEPLQRHPQGGFSFVPECIKIVHRKYSCILTSVPFFGTDIFWNRYKITPQGRAVNPKMGREKRRCSIFCLHRSPGCAILKAVPHNSRLTAQAPFRRLRHGICVAKMLDNTQSIICAFGLASAAPRSPYRHLESCGIA